MIRYTLIVLFLFSVQAQARVEFKGGQSRHNYDTSEDAREVSNFWSHRKVGVGVAMGGAHGLVGGMMGIHFHPQWSVDLGFGGGSHFQSFGIRVKKLLLMSSPLNPYLGVGFQRWYRNHSRPFASKDVSPGFVGDKFMSAEDRMQGRIDETLLHGTLGLQYVFTQGSMAGYGIFLEALLLMDVKEFLTVPTASLGFNYFF